MSDTHLSVDRQERSLRAGLSRPPLNILNLDMMGELLSVLEKAEGDPGIHAVVVESMVPGIFSAGADVKEHLPESAGKLISTFGSLITKLISFHIPTISAVQGKCLGGGMEIALACDFVLADDSATFGQPEVNVGVYPPAGAALYPRIAGLRNSCRILMTGETFSAKEAMAMGLLTRVVACGELETEVRRLLDVFGGQSRAVLGFTKRAINESLPLPLEEAVRSSSRTYLEGLMRTEDAREGLQAFLEKRKPRWRDR